MNCRYYQGIQILGVIPNLLVLTSPGSFSSCRGTSGPNGHDDIEVDKRVDNAS